MTRSQLRIVLVAVSACVFLLLAACGSVERPSGAGRARVVMKLIAFRPEVLEVSSGTTVTWTQKDAGFHTVTSGTVEQGAAGVTEKPDGKFDSGEIPTGKTFSYTLKEQGAYAYFCSFHPATMRGEVRVT